MNKHRYIKTAAVLLLIVYWAYSLYGCESFYINYILCAGAGIFFALRSIHEEKKTAVREIRIVSLFSAVFALADLLANYDLFRPFASHIVRILLHASAGFVLAFTVLSGMAGLSGKAAAAAVSGSSGKPEETAVSGSSGKKVFAVSFAVLACIYLGYLFLAAYPGIVTVDSLSQISQILSGTYTNHHPFWHTVVIRCWITVGMRLFHDMNAAVCLYSAFSALCLAAAFAYAVMTIRRAGGSRLFAGLCVFWYAAMPFHITYSVTMWKDILFAAAVTVFVTCLYRLLNRFDTGPLQYVLFILSGTGFCLWRSNGWIAFACTFLVMAVFLLKKEKKIVLLMALILAATFFLKGPLLDLLHVEQGRFVESISIPEQQIARVITEGGRISEEDMELLKKVVDPEKIPEEYDRRISNPVKYNIRAHGQEYLEAHKGELLRLWIRIGLKNPGAYVRAWIDQTVGYWNSGYRYWIWRTMVRKNDFGISQAPLLPGVRNIFETWFRVFYDLQVFAPFRSVGLHTWITAAVFMVLWIRRRKEILLTIPVLTVVGTLLLAAPVFCEFRYAYAMFASMPMTIWFLRSAYRRGTGDEL